MKYIILIPDGMADRPVDELGGKTPLEVADSPNMDSLAQKGICGMANTFFHGLPYDSSVANMSILGYDPRKYFCGRSPLEAANLGVELADGDISLRCNLITVVAERIKDFTAGHISTAEAAKLIKDIDIKLGGDGIEFHHGLSYRHLLVLRSKLNPSLDFKAKQPHDIVGELVSENKPEGESPAGEKTVELLNKLADEAVGILAEHDVNQRRVAENKKPANSIWLWGAGHKPNIPLFEDKFHIRGSLVSAVDLLKGFGKIIGMDVLQVEGATGYIDTNYEGKADAAFKSLDRVDFTYVHLESTDESGHEGSIEHKVKAIEDIDHRVLGRLLDNLSGDYAILLMPDHATPVGVKTHTTDPVPYTLYDTRRMAEGVEAFTEKDIASRHDKPVIDAFKLMEKLIAPILP